MSELFDGVHYRKIDQIYKIAEAPPTDMRVHLPFLKEIARGRRILELGVRSGMSTAALLAGRPEYMTSVDREPFPYEESYAAAANEIGVPWDFIKQDSRQQVLKEGEGIWRIFDLVFVDTSHYYEHVAAELATHAVFPSVRTLVFHDTVLFGLHGDGGWPGSEAPAGKTPPPGILLAIREWMLLHPEWKVTHDFKYDPTGMTPEDHYKAGCGLMVLEKNG